MRSPRHTQIQDIAYCTPNLTSDITGRAGTSGLISSLQSGPGSCGSKVILNRTAVSKRGCVWGLMSVSPSRSAPILALQDREVKPSSLPHIVGNRPHHSIGHSIGLMFERIAGVAYSEPGQSRADGHPAA